VQSANAGLSREKIKPAQMITYLSAFLFFLVMVLAMSVGVILAKKPIKGSCGGLNAIGMKDSCAICGDADDKAKNMAASLKGKDGLFYNAADGR
jgi:hypothetical protein